VNVFSGARTPHLPVLPYISPTSIEDLLLLLVFICIHDRSGPFTCTLGMSCLLLGSPTSCHGSDHSIYIFCLSPSLCSCSLPLFHVVLTGYSLVFWVCDAAALYTRFLSNRMCGHSWARCDATWLVLRISRRLSSVRPFMPNSLWRTLSSQIQCTRRSRMWLSRNAPKLHVSTDFVTAVTFTLAVCPVSDSILNSCITWKYRWFQESLLTWCSNLVNAGLAAPPYTESNCLGSSTSSF
jgi:hypothetical protein